MMAMMTMRSFTLGAVLLLATSGVASAQVQGVDVSEFQGNIDWPTAHGAGIGFAIARVSDGTFHIDPTFRQNWDGMRANGVVRGVYQFFRPTEDPVAQADLLVNYVGGFGQGDLPPVCDVEVTDGAGGGQILGNLQAWIDRIKARTGLTPIVYTSPGFWNGLGGTVNGATLWVANWFVSSPWIPAGWSGWTFWQYNDNGSVPGIPALVDQDVFNGSLNDLYAYANGGPPPVGGGGGGGGQPVLRMGSSGPSVVDLQDKLRAAGFDPGPSDGSFGPMTDAAVRAFQGAKGLTVDGIVGQQTWGALGGAVAPPPPPPPPAPLTLGARMLQVGDQGDDVRQLQDALRANGFDPGPSDGIFGPGTDAAVRAFQAAHGLAVDGVVGPQTVGALQAPAPPPPAAPPPSAITRLLEMGCVGDDVRALQDALRAHGFDPGPSDGIFGPATDAALRAYQWLSGLVIDGIAGPATCGALGI